MEILRIENVEKYYGKDDNITKAVDGISLSVESSEFVAIMGASGSGKTTLLNCISTIDTATGGHIYLERYDRIKSIEEYQRPVDKELWSSAPDSAPTATNCAYDPVANSIYICGAYVRYRYGSDSAKEELYADVGTTIGHEIGHAFDYNGSKYDKDGNRKNWWTDDDAANFRKKNEKLAAYFSSIHPWEGNYTRGNIKTGEAAADMTGMKCMLRLAAKDPDFDYDRFFRAYAHGWLTKETPEFARAYTDDPHPMKYQRINVTLQQFDEFLSFYDIKEGDCMYLAPEDRVSIW